MFNLSEQTRVYLKPGVTGEHLGAHGLTGLVSQMDGQDVFSGSLHVFCNKRRNQISCLLWDGSGTWLAGKYLERGTFDFPRDAAEVSQMSLSQLRLLLEGFELKSRRGWQRYEGQLPHGRACAQQLAAALPRQSPCRPLPALDACSHRAGDGCTRTVWSGGPTGKGTYPMSPILGTAAGKSQDRSDKRIAHAWAYPGAGQ